MPYDTRHRPLSCESMKMVRLTLASTKAFPSAQICLSLAERLAEKPLEGTYEM